MKKFTSVLMLLLAALLGTTAKAQVGFDVSDEPSNNAWADNTHWYLIHAAIGDTYHYKGYLCAANTNYPNVTYYHDTYGLLLNKAQQPKTSYGLWCMTGNESEGYTFYNRGTGTSKVLGLKDNKFKLIDPTASDASSYVTKFDYAASTCTENDANGAFCFKSHGTNAYWNNGNCGSFDATERASHLTTWADNPSTTATGGNAFIFDNATDDILAIADYYDARINLDIDALITQCRPYQNYPFSYSTETLNKMVDKNPTTKADAESALAELKNAKEHPTINKPVEGQKYLIKNKSYGAYLTINSSGKPVCNTDKYTDKLWTIEAGSSDGFYKIKNVSYLNSGANKYLEGKPAASGAFSSGDTGVEYKIITTSTDGVAISYNNTTTLTDYCFLHQDQSANLVCWQAQNENNVLAPSLWYFEIVSDDELHNIPDETCQWFVFNSTIGQECQSYINTYIQSERNEADVNTLNEQINAYFHQKYFRIITRSNLVIATDETGKNAKMLTSRSGMEKQVNTLWQLHPVASKHGFKLYNVNAKGYIYNTSHAEDKNKRVTAPLTPDFANTAYMYTLITEGDYFILKDGNNHYLNGEKASNDNSNCILDWWNKSGDNNRWKIEEATSVEVALNAAGNGNTYATCYLPFSINNVTNAEAYVAEAPTNNYVIVNETTNGVKAENGFLLIGAEGATTATLTIGDSETTSQMTGTLTDLDITNEDKALYNVFGRKVVDDAATTTVGFFTPSSTLNTIKANRGFFKGTGTQALLLNFGGNNITNIHTTIVDNKSTNSQPIYDLSGRRVISPVKGGLYIQQGHKFIVK